MNSTSSQSTSTQEKPQNSPIRSDIGQADTKEIILLGAGLLTLALGLGGVLMYSEDGTQPVATPQGSAKEVSTFQMAKAFATPQPLPTNSISSTSEHDVPIKEASLHLVSNALTIQQPQDIDVFFTLNRWTLSNEAKHIIKVSVDERSEDWTGTLRIDGHTDTQGTDSYNRALGLKRAESVKTYLVPLGIPEETIQVQSFGKDGEVCQESNPDWFEHNRRAHVAFLRQPVVQDENSILSMTSDSLGDSTRQKHRHQYWILSQSKIPQMRYSSRKRFPKSWWRLIRFSQSNPCPNGSPNTTNGSLFGMIEANRAKIYVRLGRSEGAQPQALQG